MVDMTEVGGAAPAKSPRGGTEGGQGTGSAAQPVDPESSESLRPWTNSGQRGGPSGR